MNFAIRFASIFHDSDGSSGAFAAFSYISWKIFVVRRAAVAAIFFVWCVNSWILMVSGRWIMYFEQRRHWTFGIGVVLMWRTKFPSTLCRRAMCSRRIFINNLYSRHSTQRICQHSRRVWFGWSSWSAVFTAKPFQLFPVLKRASPAPSCRLNWIGHHWVLAILNSRFLHFFQNFDFFPHTTSIAPINPYKSLTLKLAHAGVL